MLIHGAGGVGSLAIQLAVAAGARVLVSASAATVDLATRLGAAMVVDHATGDFQAMVRDATGDRGVDVVLDTAGGETLVRSLPVTAQLGRMVALVELRGDFEDAFRKNVAIHAVMVDQQHEALLARGREALRRLVALADRGQIAPVIDREVALGDLGDAQRALERGGIVGKIVVRVSG